ncbi:MAG: M20/M25/M40 family metallo-hydrolase, partial [Burkholderiaceae bacterium]
MIKRVFWLLFALLLLVVAAVAVNTARHGSRQLEVPPATKVDVDAAGVAERLAGAVRFQTVSSLDDPNLNADQFRALHRYLAQQFPKLHATLSREEVGGLSLLYRWPGTDENASPILLLAHQDVVPIAPGTQADWQVDPFAGTVQDGFVWGRGAWDDKGNLIAQFEAVEMLLAAGFQPR